MPLEHRTKVVVLQHPREARNPGGTARMVERGISGAERLVGVSFESDPRFRAFLAAEPVVLYMTEAARPVTELQGRQGGTTLFVVDGTWWQAAKIWRLNPTLRALPTYRIAPIEASRYRIRRGDPHPACLSTVEAVAAALDAIDGAPGRHAALLAPFEALVNRRIATASSERRSPRHRRGWKG